MPCLLTALGQLWLHGVKLDWCGFQAHERRRRIPLPTYPFQRERYWIEALGHSAPQEASRNAAAQRNPDPADWFYVPSWKQSELPTAASEKNPPTQRIQWLIFLDEGGLGGKLAGTLALRQESVTRVVIGQSFRRISAGTYAINPERSEDYVSLISELCALDMMPQKVVHLWSVSDSQRRGERWTRLEQSQSLGLHSLLFLTRALGEKNCPAKLDIEIVLNSVHLVTGEETLNPEQATVLGASKIIPLEYPNINCRGIDIIVPEPGAKSEQRLLKLLLAEFSTKPSEPVVAYRAGCRWVETFERVHLQPPPGVASRLKVNGVYLVTGGLGGIGLALAEFLATSVQAKLILVGRSALPPKEKWGDWLASHDDQDETSCRIKKLQFMESAGAEALVLAADVADRDRMQEVIALARSRFGHIDGVIHSAGSADYAGVIQRRTKEATDEVLAAKVKGTLVLDELLSNSGLDFLVLCSSRGTVVSDGLIGQTGYVAANEFLDAFAFYKRAVDGVYTVTINWDPWRDVGMAARAAKEQAEAGKMARVLSSANSLSSSEGAEIFNRILNYCFARIVVSVADLDSVRRNLSGTQDSTAASQADAPAQMNRHARPDVGMVFTAPTNELERALANIWQDLLGIKEVGVDDNFFDLGGDSLLLLRVQAKIRQALAANLSSAEMFEHSTISALARRLSQPAAESAGLGAVQDRAQLQRAALAGRRPNMKPS